MRGCIAQRAKERRTSGGASREWGKNKERNEIIRNCLGRGADRRAIREKLDHRTVKDVLPIMRKCGIYKWLTAWEDLRCYNAIQQMITKVAGPQKAVKS
jgi:hypothetical protein